MYIYIYNKPRVSADEAERAAALTSCYICIYIYRTLCWHTSGPRCCTQMWTNSGSPE